MPHLHMQKDKVLYGWGVVWWMHLKHAVISGRAEKQMKTAVIMETVELYALAELVALTSSSFLTYMKIDCLHKHICCCCGFCERRR